MSNMSDYHDSTWIDGHDLAGYDVEATDGSIGNVDKATDEVSNAYVVVDTGFWIFGKKRLIPAGAISSIEPDGKTMHVMMTKDQIKDAPDYDAERSTTAPAPSTTPTTAPTACADWRCRRHNLVGALVIA